MQNVLRKKFMTRPAIFLGRDDTLNIDKEYGSSLANWKYKSGASDFLAVLSKIRFPLILDANRAGIACDPDSEGAVYDLHKQINHKLREHGCQIAGFYHYSRRPNKFNEIFECGKRKRRLIHEARLSFDIDLRKTWLHGHKVNVTDAGDKSKWS